MIAPFLQHGWKIPLVRVEQIQSLVRVEQTQSLVIVLKYLLVKILTEYVKYIIQGGGMYRHLVKATYHHSVAINNPSK